jgi:outer membrane receptor protein involved in Fe transport
MTVRPIEGLNVRAAWSRTVARPSFREMGYYVTVEPATDDLLIGNPQLQLSDVESYDVRAEYVWGDGDSAAISAFYKEIDDPIESIVVRNPNNFEAGASDALFRTFFNNPNQGTLWGLEVEARKGFSFLPFEIAQYVSLGGNFTYIDAKVDRTEAELLRSEAFFGVAPGDNERFNELENERRLFGQPEWTANLDLSFQHPEWGTKVALVYFAISNVLDAAGSASISPNGTVFAATLDRYIDSYSQLDLNLSQTLHVDFLRGDVTFKASLKNLTNSSRGIIYDPDQTRDEIAERSFKIGRDFSISVGYTIPF